MNAFHSTDCVLYTKQGILHFAPVDDKISAIYTSPDTTTFHLCRLLQPHSQTSIQNITGLWCHLGEYPCPLNDSVWPNINTVEMYCQPKLALFMKRLLHIPVSKISSSTIYHATELLKQEPATFMNGKKCYHKRWMLFMSDQICANTMLL